MGNYELNKGVVAYHTTMSIDGFIAGPHDDMAWIFNYKYPTDQIKEITENLGALLLGRNSYNVGKNSTMDETSEAYGGAWRGPELVLTHNPPTDEKDPNKTFLNSNIKDAVQKVKNLAKGKNVHIIGANVAKQCIKEALLDEILIYIVPILLGNGVRLYEETGLNYVKLEILKAEQLGEITTLLYKIKK